VRDPLRHDLLSVAPEAWRALLAARPDLDGIPHLADWAARGWPVIARRRLPGEDAACIPAGLPLPPALGKRRIGLLFERAALTPRPGLSLDEARDTAPAAWQPTLDALIAHGADRGPRVFGALLWQALTGLPYLSATSDLDLLWPGPVPQAFLDGLARIAARAPMPIDGEIVLPDGFGLNWRELLAAGPDGTVLAKGLERLELRPAPLMVSA